jgi:hypothetical protein
MSRTFVFVIVLGAVTSGCKRHAVPAADPAPAAAPAPTTTSAPPPAPPPTLIVGGPRGLQELGADGKLLRRISRHAALRPRWLPGHHELLFLSPSGAAEVGAAPVTVLRRVAVADGAEKVVAKLGKMTVCKPSDEAGEGDADANASPLAPQSDDDFTVDKSGAFACLQLMDRNINMMDYHVSVHIDLSTGKIERRVVHGDCTLADGLDKGEAFSCDAAEPPEVPVPPHLSKPADWDVRTSARSGRWVVLEGNEETGDYIHHDALLLDVGKKQLYPLRKGKWPQPLSPAELEHLDQIRDQTAGTVGESDVRFVDGDLLIVDRLVVVPGVRAFAVDGDVVR